MDIGTVVYDVEVLRGPDEVEGGWNNPFGMGFGTAVVYSYRLDRYMFFGPDERSSVVGLLTSECVVSFNGIKFDNHVLLGPNEQAARMWSDIDLLLEVVKSKFGLDSIEAAEQTLGDRKIHDGTFSLDGLAEGTLGRGKIGHGAEAPKMIQAGQWKDVFQYNLHDVRLTRQLYDFARKYGYLVDRAGRKIKMFIE